MVERRYRGRKWFKMDEAYGMVPELHRLQCRLSQMNHHLQFLLSRLSKDHELGLEDALKLPLNQAENFFELDMISSIKLLLAGIQMEVNRLSDKGFHVGNIVKGQMGLPVKQGKLKVILAWEFGQTEIKHWYHVNESLSDKKPMKDLNLLMEEALASSVKSDAKPKTKPKTKPASKSKAEPRGKSRSSQPAQAKTSKADTRSSTEQQEA